jgi:hypothetical protein
MPKPPLPLLRIEIDSGQQTSCPPSLFAEEINPFRNRSQLTGQRAEASGTALLAAVRAHDTTRSLRALLARALSSRLRLVACGFRHNAVNDYSIPFSKVETILSRTKKRIKRFPLKPS